MSAALGGIEDVLARFRKALDDAQIPFMIAGSFASTTHGFPRTTQDLDIVIDPANLAAIESFLDGFSEENYYFDRDAARDAFRRRSMFNLVDQEPGWKIDIIIRKRRAFSESEFTRRQKITIALPDALPNSRREVLPDVVILREKWAPVGEGGRHDDPVKRIARPRKRRGPFGNVGERCSRPSQAQSRRQICDYLASGSTGATDFVQVLELELNHWRNDERRAFDPLARRI